MLTQKNSPHGGDIYNNKVEYDFSANTSPLGTPKAVKDAIIESAEYISAYPDPYCEKLIKAISSTENIHKDYIICGNGAAELIFNFASAICPKNALIVAPTFCEYENSLSSIDCNTEYFILSPDENFSPSEKICEQINDSFDVVFICNPNNPTGKLFEKNLVKQIAQKCKSCNAFLFIDECFCDLTDNPDNNSFKDYLSDFENVIILKAFTKSYGMAGVRLGYAMTSNKELLKKMSCVTQAWNVSTIAQNAGIAALSCMDFIDENRKIIKKEREYLTHNLKKLGFEVFKSQTNFILFKSNIDLYNELLKKEILIRNCGNFKGLDSSYYRCAIKNHEQNLEFILVLKEITNG